MSLLLLLALLLHSIISITAVDPLLSKCEGTNTTTNTTYRTNLIKLLNYFTSLSSTNFTTHTSGFAYGLFLCRGDILTTDCTSCIHNATRDVLTLCPNYTQATLWYDYCELRYADTQFFASYSDTSDPFILVNGQNTTDQADFLQLQNVLLSNITNQAALVSSNFFATGNAVNGSLTMSGLVQCTIVASVCWRFSSNI